MHGILTGKVVAVTGGASGIGRGICLAMARQGAKAVIIADLRQEPREGGPTTEALVTEAGADALYCRTDVRVKANVEQMVASAEIHGGLDVMVCNAGIALPEDPLTLSEEDYRRIVGVNLDGVFFSAQAAARQMVTLGKTGTIILTSSMGGLRGSPFTTVYSSTKAGVRLMAASLAAALGPKGIRVNAICPGIIETELGNNDTPGFKEAMQTMIDKTPLRRGGQPSEIGDVAVWLASDLSSFVNGAAIVADGGLSAIL